jgi:hypothetical protein
MPPFERIRVSALHACITDCFVERKKDSSALTQNERNS